ncbi:MAG: Cysteine synthase, partial [uncultured Sphingosinicella sp.]
ESRQHIGDDRQHPAHPGEPPVRKCRSVDQVRTVQSRRLDQGSHRARDGRGCGAFGRAEAGRDDHRADFGQYRHRAGDGGGGEGLQAGPGHAREHEPRAAAADARLRGDFRPDAEGKGHEGRDRAGAGADRRDAGKLDAAAVRESGQCRGASAQDGAGDPERLPRQSHRRDHHRRWHGRAHHRLRDGAEEGMAEPESVRGRADLVAGAVRRPAGTAPDPGDRRGIRAGDHADGPDRRRHPGRPERRQGDGAPLRARRRHACGDQLGRDAGGDQAEAGRDRRWAAGARLQLRYRRALSVSAGLPAGI